MDPLLIQACGPCLPPARSTAGFLALITDKYRNFTQEYQRNWVGADQKNKPKDLAINIHERSKSFLVVDVVNSTGTKV